MKNQFRFFLLAICFTLNGNLIFCQKTAFSFDGIGLETSATDSKKEIKRKFRQLRKEAPDRVTRKKLRAYEKQYFALISRDRELADSITVQKAKVDRLLTEVEEGRMGEGELEKLHAQNDSLKQIMRNYVIQIDSLNALNVILEAQLGNAGEYYFNLSEFVEPKIYYFHCEVDPSLSQYWKIYSEMGGHFLITEAYSPDFERFDIFKEQYDSTGAKVAEYTLFVGSDTVLATVGSSDVYHWKPKESIRYSVRYESDFYEDGYTKTREFGSVDSMEIMGRFIEVMRFQDNYDFYRGGEINYSFMQQSFYAKGIGMVRFLRFDEIERKNVNYILKAIYSEEEWQALRNKD